jgi:hypothetical protein
MKRVRNISCAGGTFENSPAFQRWDGCGITRRVPKGRLNFLSAIQSSLRDSIALSASNPALKRWAIFKSPSGTKPWLNFQNTLRLNRRRP